MHQQSPSGVQVIGAPQRAQVVSRLGSGMALLPYQQRSDISVMAGHDGNI
jgi:hypothetical protein